MTDSTFQGTSIPFLLQPGEHLPIDALEYLALASANGPLVVGGRNANSFLPFDVRQVYGDGTALLGAMQIVNQTASPVSGTVLTSNARMTWSDPSAAATVLISGSTATLPVSLAQDVVVVGKGAHGAVPAGNPLTTAEARTTARPAVADGQVTRLLADKLGRLIIGGTAARELQDDHRVSIATGAETVIVPALAGVAQDLTALVVTNKDTVTHVLALRDVLAGAIRLDVALPIGATVVVALSRGVIQQRVLNTDWTAQLDAAPTTNPVLITVCTERVS